MLLLSNEEQILTSNDDKIILTSKRIQLNDSYWYNSFQTTIFLEDISSIEKGFKSFILFLVIGCIACIIGAGIYFYGGSGDREISPLFFVAGIVSLIIWFFSRKHIIKIKPNGGTAIIFTITRMADNLVEEFIYKISVAKDERLNNLNKK